MHIDELINLIRQAIGTYEASTDKVARIRAIIDNAEYELKTQEEK